MAAASIVIRAVHVFAPQYPLSARWKETIGVPLTVTRLASVPIAPSVLPPLMISRPRSKAWWTGWRRN